MGARSPDLGSKDGRLGARTPFALSIEPVLQSIPTLIDYERALKLWAGRPLRGGQNRIQAAVCVPIREGETGLEAWCIKRPDHLRHHAREIAFPGGKPEPEDQTLADAAIRETEEELGIPRERLRLLGSLTPVPTATSRFTLNPFAAAVGPDVLPEPAKDEVAELIEVSFEGFFAGAIPYSAVDVGAYLSPIFDFQPGAMYGATAHVLQEALEIYAAAAGREMPRPRLTTAIPWA